MAGKTYITGDKHGSFRTFFGLRERGSMNAEDILLIAGDAGYVMDDDYRCKIRTLEQLFPGMIAFIDGNHENHRLLMSFDEEIWCGGRIHRISDHVIHLMRGEFYTINGINYFVLGGARTVSWFIESVDWVNTYEGEEPSAAELAHADTVFHQHIHEIDYVITHEAPLNARRYIEREKPVTADYTLPGLLSCWYEEIRECPRFQCWYFGHMHADRIITPKLRAIYNNVLPIGTEAKVDWS